MGTHRTSVGVLFSVFETCSMNCGASVLYIREDADGVEAEDMLALRRVGRLLRATGPQDSGHAAAAADPHRRRRRRKVLSA
jgi:hypothetical protein